jgi:hypothetical protein
MYVFLKNNNIKFDFVEEYVKEIISPVNKTLNLQINAYKKENYHLLLNTLEPYGFLYSNIYPYNFSISKLNQDCLFYEFFEIFQHISLENIFFIGNFSKNMSLINYFLYKKKMFECKINCDLCFFDLDVEPEKIVKTISEVQNKNGTSIIKIKRSNKNTELIYFLTTIYENVLLFRPKIIIDEHLYIICQKYNNTYEVNFITGFSMGIYKKIPLYFLNIINEYYSIIEQRLYYYKSQVIFYSLHDNDEKIRGIKNKNINNSIKWCETYGVPFNNIKINIFSDKVISV